MKKEGITKAELARRLGWKYPQVCLLFDVGHASKFEQLASAAQALGQRFIIGMEKTAIQSQ